MSEATPIREGQVVTGALFSEPMRVETVRVNGPGAWVAGMVGMQTERFRKVTLTAEDIKKLTILDAAFDYGGDGQLLRLGIQAYSLGIAYEFDPYFGLSISRVDPLPHQLEAIYDYLLKLARVRFLLADDAGAGKTIMAGLLIRELELRGLAERILIVCPANLSFQWQRELKEKFETKFEVMKGSDIREQFGFNQWQEKKRVITSLDLAKRQDILPGLRQVHWDLVIVDEAHRMSAADETHKSLRYKLGELLRDTTDHLLLLTATPHKGDPQNFSLFLQLLDADAFADVKSIRHAMDRRRAPFYLRRTKEAMVYFPERKPDGTWVAEKIFTKRIPHTVDFQMDGAEFDLYRAVTRFVKEQSTKAAAQGDDPRARAVGFLMSLYQRRLASSTFAMRRSLENRARRLDEGLKRAQDLVRQAPPDLPSPDEVEEMEESERAALRDRPAFLPLEWTGPKNYMHGFWDYESHPRKPLCVITERGPWPWMKPLLPDERVRDVKVGVAPDGYYFSGSTISHPGKMSIWRSKDLATWEMLPPAWTYEQIEWLPEKKPYAKGVYPEDPNGLNIDWTHIFWHTYVTWWKDTFYITFVIFDNDNPASRGTTALKSTSGKMEGPYISLGKVGGQFGADPGPVWEDPMFIYKKQLYSSDWKGWRDHVAIADVNVPGWKWDWKRVDHGIYDIMQRGDCTLVDAIEDVPIYCFRSSGPLDGGEKEHIGTYDVNYVAMESPWGPVRKGAKPRCVPHVAVSNIFKDHQGRWWASMFGTENTAPWVEKFGLVALKSRETPRRRHFH